MGDRINYNFSFEKFEKGRNEVVLLPEGKSRLNFFFF